MNRDKNLSGQTIVLFAIVLVGMFAVIGLAIDAGLLMNEHSQAQAVSDAASMGAAQELISNGGDLAAAESEGYQVATTAGYNNNGTSNNVSLTVTGPYDENGIPVYYVDTTITSYQKIFIMQIFTGKTELPQTADTTVRIQYLSTTGPYFDGYGLIAFANGEKKIFEASGGVIIYTHSGGIYSAESLDLSGGVFIDTEGGDIFTEKDLLVSDSSFFTTSGGNVVAHGEFEFSGNPSSLDGGNIYTENGLPKYGGTIDMGGGEIYTNGTIAIGPQGYVNNANRVYSAVNITSQGLLNEHVNWAVPEANRFPIIIPDHRPNDALLPKPNCTGMPNYGAFTSSSDPEVINPGIYDSIKHTTGTLIMNPGLYCIGGDFSINGGTVEAYETLIYINDDASVVVNGGANLKQTAPTSLFDSAGYEWIGMAFYFDYDYNIDVTINGGAGASYSGTIYGPTADCTWTGSAIPIYNKAQVVCGIVSISGSVEIDFDYDPDVIYQPGSGIPIISLEIIE